MLLWQSSMVSAAKMSRQLDQIRSMPEVRQMSAKFNDLSSDPQVQRQLDIARRQLTSAMELRACEMDSPELRSRMNSCATRCARPWV